MKQSDHGATVVIEIADSNGAPLNLTGATVTVITRIGTTRTEHSAQVTGPGKAAWTVPVGLLDVPGYLHTAYRVEATGRRLSTDTVVEEIESVL